MFDRLGDVQTTGMGEQGLFFQDTRHLSNLIVTLWGTQPLLLSSTVDVNNFMFTADLANLDVCSESQVVIPRGTLHILRSRFLSKNTCYEELTFMNHGLSDLLVPFRTSFESDFADIFEVRGMHRRRRGTLRPPVSAGQSVLLSYEGLDGKLRETRIAWDTAPCSASEHELNYEVLLRPREKKSFRMSICCDSAMSGRSIGYSAAMSEARRELDTEA